MNSKEFSLIIEKLYIKKKPISYMDTILLYCTENEVEPEQAGRLLTKALKEKIEQECIEANMLKVKKSGKLPV